MSNKTFAKHLQNFLEPREVDGYKTFYVILHVTTVYLQAVFDRAKNVLQHFCKCFSVKHFKNISEVVKCKIEH